MADSGLQVKITGLTEVEKVFLNLPKSTAKKAYKPALRAGAKVIRKLAASNVKSIVSNDSTHTLERGLAVYILKPVNGNYRAAVMVRRGLVNKLKIVNGQPVRVGLYASVLEYGKEGQPPRSWIRKAAREGTEAALSAITTEMDKRMEDAVKDAKQ